MKKETTEQKARRLHTGESVMHVLRSVARLFRPLPTSIQAEAYEIYSRIWPKHPAYEHANIGAIVDGLMRVRRSDLACPHRKIERLGHTMWLSNRNSIWEWCSQCGAVRRQNINLGNNPVGEPEHWHMPGKDLYERTDTTTPDEDVQPGHSAPTV